jgi:hypothetical protein
MAPPDAVTTAKERVYAQAVSFFSTNEAVLTALTASFTGMHRPAREHPHPGKHEGGREPVARGARRDRRQGAGGGAQGRLRPDHPRRRGQEAGRRGGVLPGAGRARSSRRCACTAPQRGEIRDAVEDGKRRLARSCAAAAGSRGGAPPRMPERPRGGGPRSTRSCSRWTWWTPRGRAAGARPRRGACSRQRWSRRAGAGPRPRDRARADPGARGTPTRRAGRRAARRSRAPALAALERSADAPPPAATWSPSSLARARAALSRCSSPPAPTR